MDAGKPSKSSERRKSPTKATSSATQESDSADNENGSTDAPAAESSGIEIILGADGLPDLDMMDYADLRKKWKREDPLTEAEVDSITAPNLSFFAGGAQPMKKPTYLANALVVNRRRGKVFERAGKNCTFDNFLMKLPGVEHRGAARLKIVHPLVGQLEIHSLHLDHVWEKNRHGQFDLLYEKHLSLENAPPHIIMGDFNAITKTDYTPDYEEEYIRSVREKGNWEVPTYTLLKKLESYGYVDYWRRVNPTIQDHDVTTCAYNTRIDYIFISPKLVPFIDWEHPNSYSHILSGVNHSDHFPVLANIQFKRPE